jgi:hypothetical protein
MKRRIIIGAALEAFETFWHDAGAGLEKRTAQRYRSSAASGR